MLEQTPSVQEKILSNAENTLELPNHLDISKLMAEKNAFFVHTFASKAFNVSDTNKSIDTNKLSMGDKLDLVYGVSPTLSASTIRPHTSDETFDGGFGVIFSHGEVVHAHQGDAATRAVSLTERDVLTGAKNEKNDVDRAIEKSTAYYNELVLKNPEVAGGFMKLASFSNSISYHNEEQKYYDGGEKITKIGIIDMNNTFDKAGRLTARYDAPFSTLLEMQKRGKVFVMDEGNQMYIVQNIDEVHRKVEFVAAPIEPKDFAYHYGEERVNKYAKLEMKDRLQKSLSEKGMTLH
jgi:hypothetical protein